VSAEATKYGTLLLATSRTVPTGASSDGGSMDLLCKITAVKTENGFAADL
jgi:hypothetical protein